jgi:methyl-accepting chemotaxis protein
MHWPHCLASLGASAVREVFVSQLRQLNIGTRLGLGFALLITAMVISAVFTAWKLAVVNAEVKQLLQERMTRVEQVTRIKDNANLIARSVRNMALLKSAADIEREQATLIEARKDNMAIMQSLEGALKSDDDRLQFKAMMEARAPYGTTMDEALKLVTTGQRDALIDWMVLKVQPAQAGYFDAMDKLRQLQSAKMHESGETVEAMSSAIKLMTLLAASLCAVGGAWLAWSITQSITVPLAQAMKVADAVAQGELRQQFHDAGQDEPAQLLNSLGTMSRSLGLIVGQVRQSSDSIATGSSQIASGNADLSHRTEEQAANVQQTVCSMAQLATTVRNNADTAQTATQLASHASASATKGGDLVSQVVATMEGISSSSKKIGDIIGVIDGIAFQTNILALNAAVEAARAGEQGRGFAVVASEVRMLAQRSADAAKEIKSLISQSVEQVEAGSVLVHSAGSTMGDIVSEVKRVSDLINEISAATHEQTLGIEQVTGAAGDLDQVTQQNAALVEQSAAAADSLQQQAGQLASMVSVFKL